MKNQVVLSVLLALFVLIAAGCEDEKSAGKSLAGSVMFQSPYRILEAECIIKEDTLIDMDDEGSFMMVYALASDSISMYFDVVFGNDSLHIEVPKIQLQGVAFDVSFDSRIDDCLCKLNGEILPFASTYVSGYMRESELGLSDNATKNSPREYQYDVEVNISAEDIDGDEVMEFKVMSITM